jgi:hypothetical protein
MVSNLDTGSSPSQKGVAKIFLQGKESNFVVEAKSFEEISIKSQKSKPLI